MLCNGMIFLVFPMKTCSVNVVKRNRSHPPHPSPSLLPSWPHQFSFVSSALTEGSPTAIMSSSCGSVMLKQAMVAHP